MDQTLETLSTPHGELALPAFFPDATRGVIRSVGADDLEECGVQGLMVNAFHLLSRPGSRAIAAHGGVHSFMNWSRPVAADSGGFQVYSLLDGASSDVGSVSNKGFVCRLGDDGKRIVLTPEKCVQTQFRLGADLLFCLDYCTHPDDPPDKQRRSVELTVAWARRCRAQYDRLVEEKQLPANKRPLLLAVVQGGEDPDLRRECAESLLEIGFDGYAYGGWPIDADGRLCESVAQVAELVPDHLPRFALGIGKPNNLVKARACGYDLFDCVIPTRDARRRRLYVFTRPPTADSLAGPDFHRCLYLQDKKHARDRRPLEDGCDCLCCRRYSRAYLHHLFRIHDGLADRLATMHNLRFYRRLVAVLAKRPHQEPCET